MKHYVGEPVDELGFPARVVVVDEHGSKPLRPRNDLYNHSPDGFAWGYGGSGPAQLALAILADAVGVEFALRHHQDFKFDVVAKLSQTEGWTLTAKDISDWRARQ